MSRSLSTFPFPPTLRQRLLQCGFSTQLEVEELSASTLAQELSIPIAEAIQILRIVKGEYKPKSRSALEMLEEEKLKRPISIMSQNLDQLLGGGARVGEITEFCGVPGIGKTQIGMQIACVATAPEMLGGAFGGAVYIDTEGSFLAERVAEIASCLLPHIPGCADVSRQAAAQLSQHILQNIYCYRLFDYTEQLACVKTLPSFLAAHRNVRVIIMDSVAFHFRRGFKDYSIRARLLTGLAQELLKIGNDFDVAVVVMNQVTTKIGARAENKDDSLTPALGESWSHACTNRVMLYWDEQGVRHAKILKSPSQKVADVVYYVTSTGVRDILEEKETQTIASGTDLSAQSLYNSSSSSSAASLSLPCFSSTSSASSTSPASVLAGSGGSNLPSASNHGMSASTGRQGSCQPQGQFKRPWQDP